MPRMLALPLEFCARIPDLCHPLPMRVIRPYVAKAVGRFGYTALAPHSSLLRRTKCTVDDGHRRVSVANATVKDTRRGQRSYYMFM